MKREKTHKSESELCIDFIAWSKAQGWTAYSETGGWDIVLVRSDGVQIGVQAKLHPNLKVVAQCIGAADFTWLRDPITGPDFRAILVPKTNRELEDVARVLGVTVFSAWGDWKGAKLFKPMIGEHQLAEDKLWVAESRIRLPDFVPDVVAGSPCPIQLTDWKVKALRITALLELRGFVTRDDFKKLNLSFQRWPVSRWIKCVHGTKKYTRGERLQFDKQHPSVFAEVRALVETELAEEKAAS